MGGEPRVCGLWGPAGPPRLGAGESMPPPASPRPLQPPPSVASLWTVPSPSPFPGGSHIAQGRQGHTHGALNPGTLCHPWGRREGQGGSARMATGDGAVPCGGNPWMPCWWVLSPFFRNRKPDQRQGTNTAATKPHGPSRARRWPFLVPMKRQRRTGVRDGARQAGVSRVQGTPAGPAPRVHSCWRPQCRAHVQPPRRLCAA